MTTLPPSEDVCDHDEAMRTAPRFGDGQTECGGCGKEFFPDPPLYQPPSPSEKEAEELLAPEVALPNEDEAKMTLGDQIAIEACRLYPYPEGGEVGLANALRLAFARGAEFASRAPAHLLNPPPAPVEPCVTCGCALSQHGKALGDDVCFQCSRHPRTRASAFHAPAPQQVEDVGPTWTEVKHHRALLERLRAGILAYEPTPEGVARARHLVAGVEAILASTPPLIEGDRERRLIYLASPYSSPDPAVMEARFEAVCREAAMLMGAGLHVYSPIAHTHPIAVQGDLPKEWAYWEAYDRVMLAASTEVIVLQLDGWDASKGVAAEVEIAREMGLPVSYRAPAPIDPVGEERT